MARAFIQQQKSDRPRYAARAKQYDLLPLYPHAVRAHGAVKPRHIRIIALISAFGAHQRIDRADPLCRGIDLLQIRDHLALIGHRHIHSRKIKSRRPLYRLFQLSRRRLQRHIHKILSVNLSQTIMDHRRYGMSHRIADQS